MMDTNLGGSRIYGPYYGDMFPLTLPTGKTGIGAGFHRP